MTKILIGAFYVLALTYVVLAVVLAWAAIKALLSLG